MDFELSDEQRLLQDSVTRLLADRYTFEARKGFLKQPRGWSEDLWARYAELGLLGLPFAETHGGFAGGSVEIMLVMQALGGALALEPYLATVVLAGTAIKLGGSAAQQAALLPAIAEGRLRLAFAHAERQARYDVADVMTTAKREGANWVLDGAKSVVLHGDFADKLVVSARLSGKRDDPDGIGLFLVDGNADGLARRGYTLRDETRAAELSLTDVHVPDADRLGEPGRGAPDYRARDRGRHRSDGRRGCGRDGSHARDDPGLCAHPRAVRPSDRAKSSGPASLGGNADGIGAGAQHGDARNHQRGGAGCRRTGAQHVHGEGGLWPGCAFRLATSDPVAWRHWHDRGIRGRPLLPPLHGDRA